MKTRSLALLTLLETFFLLSVLFSSGYPAVAQGPQPANTPRPASSQKPTPTAAVVQKPISRVAAPSVAAFSDDFSSDPNTSGQWSIHRLNPGDTTNEASWDSGTQAFYLTRPAAMVASAVFANYHLVATQWQASFKYEIGGGSGSDGFVFMFYKNESMYGAPGCGGGLGFQLGQCYPSTNIPGYGIEFDTYFNAADNIYDPYSNHIALIKDCVCTHLSYSAQLPPLADNIWHNVLVTFDHGHLVVYKDGNSVVDSVISNPDYTYPGIGFSAATAGGTNNHIVDDFVLTVGPVYSVSGHITDDNGAYIQGVTVLASTGTSAVTDASGNYTITNLITGTYTITPTKSSYIFAPITHTVRVPLDATGQNFRARPAVPSAFLDLPFNYIPLNFATAAMGNIDSKGPGRVNSWFDHNFPNYGLDYQILNWQGSPPRSYPPGDPKYPNDNCAFGFNCYAGHNGIDFAKRDVSSPTDDVIYAAAVGTITKTLYSDAGYGNQVWIDHHNGYATLYGHLKTISVTVPTVINNPSAQPLGIMGNTGKSTGIHLHFGVYYDKNGDGQWTEDEVVDPYAFSGTDPWVAAGGPQSFYLWNSSVVTNTIAGTLGANLTSPSGMKNAFIPNGALSTTLTIQFGDVSPIAAPSAQLRSTGLSFLMQVLEWLTGGSRPSRLAPNTRTAVASFSQPVTLTVTYGVTETQHLNINQLTIYRWDDIGGNWVALPTTVDTNLKQATAQTTEPGNFDLQAPLICAADNQETDDNYYVAKQISISGTKASRLFDIAGDEDWLKFETITGARYQIQTSNLATNVDTIVRIYNLDGVTLLASDDNSGGGKASRLLWQAPTTGTYFIRVLQANGSVYGCNATYQVSVTSPSLYLPLIMR